MQNVIDKTFTCNENSRKIFIDYFKRKTGEVKTIYIGVDEKKFDPDKYNRKDLIRKFKYGKYFENKIVISYIKIVISYICRIAEQKRPYLFFEIIKKLAEIRNDFVVIVAGDGPMLNGLKRKVREEKLDNFFAFVGNIKRTERIYAMSDLTVNTSIKEGLALTSYESLSMGVPIVSSDVGGQKELINEKVGVIVPCIQGEKEIYDYNYSEEEILNYVVAIQKVINNLQFYKSNCRKRILNDFTQDKMIKNMEKEFIELIKNPNKEKVENAKKIAENIRITKELISSYFIAEKNEYEWLSEKFNKENIHTNKVLNKKQFYEHTLEYKLKHPIVVTLRRMGVYDNAKRILGMQ